MQALQDIMNNEYPNNEGLEEEKDEGLDDSKVVLMIEQSSYPLLDSLCNAAHIV